eukprot:TRINITY_DN1083_c0_g1_i1.p1 TRINITY_DN1083_c0_g1~~TRINITY_DN1083_c0_g1_i1.p1  ORF type:complete len:427 (-),score=56.41 TRINITY_DN1083_c0_g1_i1:285-1565(-)
MDNEQTISLVGEISEARDIKDIVIEYEESDELMTPPHILPKVGSNFQVDIEDVMSKTESYESEYDCAREGELLWTPDKLSSESVEHFLSKTSVEMTNSYSQEEILHILQSKGYDTQQTEEYVKKRGTGWTDRPDLFDDWSEEEISKFEEGMRLFPKRFNKISKDFVPSKCVGDIVHYYYVWRKLPRHAAWVLKNKMIQLSRKRKRESSDLSRSYEESLTDEALRCVKRLRLSASTSFNDTLNCNSDSGEESFWDECEVCSYSRITDTRLFAHNFMNVCRVKLAFDHVAYLILKNEPLEISSLEDAPEAVTASRLKSVDSLGGSIGQQKLTNMGLFDSNHNDLSSWDSSSFIPFEASSFLDKKPDIIGTDSYKTHHHPLYTDLAAGVAHFDILDNIDAIEDFEQISDTYSGVFPVFDNELASESITG